MSLFQHSTIEPKLERFVTDTLSSTELSLKRSPGQELIKLLRVSINRLCLRF